eukprot:TRINITY_DN8180_c0_g1_i2.p1 TRINITY_DN8180_c0_g1~~TRINITY_DN8180_c0_g1_i2.p1  ORF type:complete len:932 (+),score=154.70 TRINITY_DN8180_c0_g1_i2:171-2798(+)
MSGRRRQGLGRGCGGGGGGASAALRVSLVLSSGLLRSGEAALSISSGYETFLTQIRRRIVCEESDVYDEAVERGVPVPCDSLEHGPFCRGLPTLPQAVRHRPFTVDSIVPQHLFGDAGAEVSGDSRKQATQTMNTFLEEFYYPKQAPSDKRQPATEGRLDFSKAWLGANKGRLQSNPLPSFSEGLPEGVVATFSGAWQEVLLPHEVDGQRRTAALRLNGAAGRLRFNRPVVIRRLMVRPPVGLEASESRHLLQVRARKMPTAVQENLEQWRQDYAYAPQASPASIQLLCDVGDLVAARHANGNYYLAIVMAAEKSFAYIRWLDDEQAYRLSPWRHMWESSGQNCGDEVKDGPSLRISKAAKAGRPVDHTQDVWRDMSRSLKAVEEVSFTVPAGADGWLLSDIVVAAPAWEPVAFAPGKGSPPKQDPRSYMVQVYPGSLAVIVEASHAAVLYDADDMLEQGLKVRKGPTRLAPPNSPAPTPWVTSEVVTTGQSDDSDDGEGSTRLRTNMHMSGEGLQQFLRSLARPPPRGIPEARLPPHVSRDAVFADLEKFVSAIRVAGKQEVKKYGHFEQYLMNQWEWLLDLDNLRAAYERWRRDPAVQHFGRRVFQKGQEWSGIYHCTQGATEVHLKVKEVQHKMESVSAGDGVEMFKRSKEETVLAELVFNVHVDASEDEEEKTVKGSYLVSGTLDGEGRSIALEPVPRSWTNKPSNFVMVGLHGVATKNGMTNGSHRFAGAVPIFGCDSFELHTLPEGPSFPSPARRKPQSDDEAFSWLSENALLARMASTIEGARERWRSFLSQIVSEKKQKASAQAQKGGEGAKLTKDLTMKTVEKFLKAARRGEQLQMQVETTTNTDGDGTKTIVLKLGDQEVQIEAR